MATDKKIEIIKHFVDRADGFEYEYVKDYYLDYEYITTPDDSGYSPTEHVTTEVDKDNWNKVYWPLFLQRAIEGVNRGLKGFFITADCQGLRVYGYLGQHRVSNDTYFNFDEYKSEDDAKLAALEWIMEKEK